MIAASSPATDASLHVSSSAPNAETGQSLPDAPTVLFGDADKATIGQPTPIVDDGAADPDKTRTGDELARAGHDNVPWRRGGV